MSYSYSYAVNINTQLKPYYRLGGNNACSYFLVVFSMGRARI